MNDMRFNKPPEPEKPEEEKKEEKHNRRVWQKINKKYVLFVLVLLIIVVLVGVAVNFYMKAQKLESEVQTTSSSEVQKIVAEVGKLLVLPESEEPTVATISNVEELRGQAFFANAKNGDKVLIYSNARKAILYDPIQKIIIEVAPLNISGSAQTP
jgi:hypothetical protein